MPKLKKAILITILIFFVMLISGLNVTTITRAQSELTPFPLVPTQIATALPQVDNGSAYYENLVLKAQLEEMKFYDQRLLASVYWSLGIVVTIALLIAGFSWFTNFRLYERDKESLRRELLLEIDKYRSEIKVLFSEQKNNLSVSLEKLVKDKLQEEFSDIDYRLARLKTELTRNQLDTKLLEAKIWALKGVHINAIKIYISALEEAISKDQSLYYASILDGILGNVENLDWITAHTMADFENLFNKLPIEQQPACNTIRDKLKEKLK